MKEDRHDLDRADALVDLDTAGNHPEMGDPSTALTSGGLRLTDSMADGGIGSLLGDDPKLHTVAQSEVYFKRPNDLDWFRRLDGREEHGSAFNPYWQARLTEMPYLASVTALMVEQGEDFTGTTELISQVIGDITSRMDDLFDLLDNIGLGFTGAVMNTHPPMHHKRMSGQAMTELVVAATFILVPLFLIVPAFGKFVDMRHATIQAARYQAWEYTVWYAENCERAVFTAAVFAVEECPMGGFEAHNNLPIKTRETTRRESIARFFGSPDGSPLATVAAGAGAAVPIPTNLSWYDHTGNQLYNNNIGGGQPVSSQSPRGIPVLDTIFDVVLGAAKLVFGAFADVLGFLGSDAGFDAINTDGLASSAVSIRMNSAATKTLMALDGGPDLTFSSQAAVLTDGWNAGGREHTYNQASGMIITSGLKALQNLPGIREAWDIITAIIAPEMRRCNVQNYLQDPYDNEQADNIGSLWFGHVDSEAVHRDRLDDGSEGHISKSGGRFDFADTFTREKECIP